MARNQYAGPCKDCGETVEAGAGYFERQRGGGWKVRHVLCTARAKVASGASLRDLSLPQREALRTTEQHSPEERA